MKKIILMLLLGAAVASCHRESDVSPNKGSLVFSLENSTNPISGGRTQDADKPSSVIISIKDSQGNFIEQDKQLPLFNFGISYTTESLQLVAGNYTITQFQVLNENKDVIYASPLEGSKLANQVSDPLPVSFIISKDGSTLVNVEVLPVVQNTPENFGYASFGFKIVQPEKNINLSFIASTNPFMATHGYDSAIVTFIPFPDGGKTIRKKLKIISPVQGIGTIHPSELGIINGVARSWKIEVRAYYESIDEVLFNLHINEAITNAIVDITAETTLLKFEETKLKASNLSGVYALTDLYWENWAHVTDETGYFHVVVKNDICDPQVKYNILKGSVDVVYYYKEIWSANSDGSNYQNYGSKYSISYYPISLGQHIDNTTFANFCPSASDGNKYGDFYFSVDNLYCYLVWLYKDTPIDPQNPDGPQKKVGGFQLSTTQIHPSPGGREKK